MKRYCRFLFFALLTAMAPAYSGDVPEKLCPDPLFGGANLDEWQGDEILFLLGLDHDQTLQIEAIKTEHEQARAQNLQRLDELTQQLETLNPDSADFEDTVSVIARERAELVGEQVRQRIRMVAAIQATLNPDQRILLEEKMTERLRRQTLARDRHANRP